MELFRATIPLLPKTKKNNQKIIPYRNKNTGRISHRIVQNEDYLIYEGQAGWYLKNKPKIPIDRPVNVKCVFYRDSYRRCDLTNLLEAIDDILVKYEVLKDDCFKILASHDGSRVLVDKEHPRTEITIETLDEDTEEGDFL